MERTKFTACDFAELRFPIQIDFSPCGRRLAYTVLGADGRRNSRWTNIWIRDLDDDRAYALTDGVGSNINPRWSPDGKEIAYISSIGNERQLVVKDVATGTVVQLTKEPYPPLSFAWSPCGERIVFLRFVPEPVLPFLDKYNEIDPAAEPVPYMTDLLPYKADIYGYLGRGYFHYFVVSKDGGSNRQLTFDSFHDGALTPNVSDPSWSPDGGCFYFSANRNKDWITDARQYAVYRFDMTERSLQVLTDLAGPCFSPTVSPCGDWLAFTGYEDEGMSYHANRLYVMDLKSNGVTCLTEDLDRGISELMENGGRPLRWSHDSSSIYGFYDDHGRSVLARFDLGGGKETVTDKAGMGGSAYSFNAAFDISLQGSLAVSTTDTARPAEIDLLDQRSGRSVRLTSLNEDVLSAKHIGETREVFFQSSFDAAELQGWAVYPPDFDDSKKYPLILEIHGGPHTNYGPRFCYQAQSMANAGYIVFYMNPRGSTSYGEEFANGISQDVPGNDYFDLMSGVDHMVGLGNVDEDYLFVAGGSYGGTMAAWIVGKTNRFRAAASLYPVVDWTSFQLTCDVPAHVAHWFPDRPWRDPEHFSSHSILSQADSFETPVLVMCGDNDHRTPLSQSEMLYQALKLKGVESLLVRFPDEAHGILGRPSSVSRRIALIIDWFEYWRRDDKQR